MTTPHQYTVYGITVSSEIPLPLPSGGDGSLGQVRLSLASPEYFEAAAGSARRDPEWTSWFQYQPLPGGSSYVHGWEMGELLISADGRHIACLPHDGAITEPFQVYLLGQGLSFALLKLGFEPLHATAVIVDGQAIALMAGTGLGKSTLAAAFVAAGCPVLTDDVLMLQGEGPEVLAFPGPPRLKLFPKAAGALRWGVDGAVPLNACSPKLVLPLHERQSHQAPVPLAAMYELVLPRGTPGPQQVTIDAVTGRDAALAIVQAAFNQRLVTRERLARQFRAAIDLAERVPLRRLTYPRVLARLPEVVGAVRADVAELRAPALVPAP